jgi:DNA-binding MltR family transcriptional regulator
MEKWTNLNMDLRSFVISRVLRLEQSSTSLIKSILRFLKEDLKTLSHKSGALSFKSRIDLLYDLEEIDKTNYSHLLKLMEIRNQFAHNHNAITFESLDEFNPGLNKYLEKYQNANISEGLSREDKLKKTFADIFVITCGRLMTIEMEYNDGIQEEYKAHVNNKAVENIDEIWNSAYEYNVEQSAKRGLVLIPQTFKEDLEFFKHSFNLKLAEFTMIELDKIKEDRKEVFRKKLPLEEKVRRLKEEDE